MQPPGQRAPACAFITGASFVPSSGQVESSSRRGAQGQPQRRAPYGCANLAERLDLDRGGRWLECLYEETRERFLPRLPTSRHPLQPFLPLPRDRRRSATRTARWRGLGSRTTFALRSFSPPRADRPRARGRGGRPGGPGQAPRSRRTTCSPVHDTLGSSGSRAARIASKGRAHLKGAGMVPWRPTSPAERRCSCGSRHRSVRSRSLR